MWISTRVKSIMFFPELFFVTFGIFYVYSVIGAWDESKKVNIIKIGTAVLEINGVTRFTTFFCLYINYEIYQSKLESFPLIFYFFILKGQSVCERWYFWSSHLRFQRLDNNSISNTEGKQTIWVCYIGWILMRR